MIIQHMTFINICASFSPGNHKPPYTAWFNTYAPVKHPARSEKKRYTRSP